MSWGIADIPGLGGKTALVTGANGGLGRVVARELGAAGARVLVACRDPQRGRASVQELRRMEPQANFELVELDLASLSSVREASAAVHEAVGRLDLLVNNAGVMAPPRLETEDGFELQLATNHLGHFALTGLLLDLLASSPTPRVVNVSSSVHRGGRIDFQDPHSTRRYGRWSAYAQSKLANLLFTFELALRANEAGWGLLAAAAHPGWSATNLQFAGMGMGMDGNSVIARFTGLGNRLFAQSAESGSLPLLYAATSPDVPPGAFVGPDGPFEMRGSPVLVEPSPAARDEIAARRLWQLSAELTGVRYAWPVGAAAA